MSFQTLEAVATRTAVVRVDLLPPDVDEARGERRLKVGLGVVLAGVVGLAAAAYGMTAGHVGAAEEALAAEQDRTLQLQRAQDEYAEVPQVLAQLQAAQKVQADVSAYEVPLYAYLDRLAGAAPEDLTYTSVAFRVVPPTAGETPTVVDPLSVPGIGTLTVTGETSTQSRIAEWMDGVSAIGGLADPRLTNSVLDQTSDTVTFNATATLTDDALLGEQ
ncbi:hypothetical protein [Kineococcus sp. SYSU DK004]|uniref:hypothetical protein n=1 Tax=Kineococcus sp. SYSU DK004 TaxID=3383125 RepID=UPI003D7CD59B